MSQDNMKSCADAAQAYTLAIETNREILKYNQDQTDRYRAAHAAWILKKQDYERKLADWQNLRGDYAKYKDKDFQEKFFLDGMCWGASLGNHVPRSGNTDWQCGNRASSKNLPYAWDWQDTGERSGSGCGCCYRENWYCQRSQSSIDNANRAWQSEKPSFVDMEPVDKIGDYAHRDQMNVGGNILCCLNYASFQTGSNIQQSCEQSVTVENYSLGITPPPKTTPPESTPEPTPPPKTTPSTEEEPTRPPSLSKQPQLNNNLLIGGGIAGISSILLCICIIIVFILLSSSSN